MGKMSYYDMNRCLCKNLCEWYEKFEATGDDQAFNNMKEIVEVMVGLTELEAAGAMREYFEDEHGYDSTTGRFDNRGDWYTPNRIYNATTPPTRYMPPYTTTYDDGRDYDMMMNYDGGMYNRAGYPPVRRDMNGMENRGRSRDSRGRYNEGYGVYNMAHEKEELSKKQMQDWIDSLQNADGTRGETFSKEESAAIARKVGAKFDNYTEEDFALVLNMLYSDYCEALEKADAKADKIETYGYLALAWLEDDDAVPPAEKIYNYYKHIVRH